MDRRSFGADLASTSAIRVCQPGPVASQGFRSDAKYRIRARGCGLLKGAGRGEQVRAVETGAGELGFKEISGVAALIGSLMKSMGSQCAACEQMTGKHATEEALICSRPCCCGERQPTPMREHPVRRSRQCSDSGIQ